MASNELPVTLTLEGVNELWDAVASLVLTRFVSGDEPFAESLQFAGVRRADEVVPIDAVRWKVTELDSDNVLARGSGWSALVRRRRNGTADVTVTARSADELAKAVADVRCRAPLAQPKPESVEIEFWYEAGDCIKSTKRRIDVPRWDAIAANYPSSVREKVASLVEMGPPSAGGRLLLWHGPPGTGKTTAIRALVREWSTWCRALFVVDAERFLGHGSYLMSVLLGASDPADDEEGPCWRVLVIEDADELLRADAKKEAGQSLSRLLSLADGFIGQGVNVLVLITTNEEIGRLHPAVARPGRCLADIEFSRLDSVQAAALIGRDAAEGRVGEMSLAEVFERRGDVARVCGRVDDEARPGQYL